MRLSYSSTTILQRCPFLYEATKIRDLTGEEEYQPEDGDTNYDLAYGKTLGVGFQKLLSTEGDVDAAIFSAACAYSFWESDKKCFEGIVHAILDLAETFPFAQYEMLLPEAAIRIDLGEKDWWCGFVDGILKDKETGKYLILEVKSCGQNRQDLTPLYQNDAQGLGYSVVLPHLMGSMASFDVLYLVAHLPGKQWIPQLKTYTFHKTAQMRLEWLVSLMLDYEQYCRYRTMQFWPKRGQNCMSYGRACELFGICQTLDLEDYPYKEPDKITLREHWDIQLPLQALIDYELEKTA